MPYATLTLKHTFLRQALALNLPEPIRTTKTKATFKLTEEQFTNVRRVTVPMCKTKLPEDKLAAANIRRAAEGALRDIEAAQKKIDSRAKPKKKKDLSKTKKTCSSCGANVWGKYGLHVWCGDCDVQMQEVS